MRRFVADGVNIFFSGLRRWAMSKTWIVKRIDGLELWTSVTETTQHFAIKTRQKRARVLGTLAEAEAYFADALDRARLARAH